MDLGGLASPDIEKRAKDSPAYLEKKDPDLESSAPASGSGRKNAGPKDTGHTSLNFVNKSATQFKKPTHRKASPINWFPRKKTDSFLKRKIRHLQEVAGMNLSLDETLGNANPHYTRMAREKIAAQEAARKVVEARKAALIEASWCRILRAARICTKVAEAELEKAEHWAAEAFEAARAMGVMMYDKPDCPMQTCEIETSSANGGRLTHTVATSFETAFEVDKEVAAAVKRAFIQLANSPSSSNKEEFREMLHKISENPETNDSGEDILTVSSECETDLSSQVEKEFVSDADAVENDGKGIRLGKQKTNVHKTDDNNPNLISSTELVDKMLERLKSLHEDELSSLAVIVATCGLNAALLEVQYSKEPADAYAKSMGVMDDNKKENKYFTKVPSLDKFRVKHMSRLEKEVQDARNSRKINSVVDNHEDSVMPTGCQLSNIKTPTPEFASDLESVLVKHVSRLEREVEEARKLRESNWTQENQETSTLLDMQVHRSQPSNNKAAPSEFTSDLGSILVKHVSRLEKEVQEARNSNKSSIGESKVPAAGSRLSNRKATTSEFTLDLGSVLIKHVSRLEREIQQARKKDNISGGLNAESGDINSQIGAEQNKENLDSNIVKEPINEMHQAAKHMSRIERARLEVSKAFSQNKDGTNDSQEPGGLDKILVKPLHRLEKEKAQAMREESEPSLVDARTEVRQRELQEAWGGLSLDNCIRPHLSRLEREKAAWRKAEEEERLRLKEL